MADTIPTEELTLNYEPIRHYNDTADQFSFTVAADDAKGQVKLGDLFITSYSTGGSADDVVSRDGGYEDIAFAKKDAKSSEPFESLVDADAFRAEDAALHVEPIDALWIIH